MPSSAFLPAPRMQTHGRPHREMSRPPSYSQSRSQISLEQAQQLGVPLPVYTDSKVPANHYFNSYKPRLRSRKEATHTTKAITTQGTYVPCELCRPSVYTAKKKTVIWMKASSAVQCHFPQLGSRSLWVVTPTIVPSPSWTCQPAFSLANDHSNCVTVIVC